jgi:CheY-like chemotaxis protein
VLTALVVDADSDERRRTTGLLRLGGWQVLEAATAEEALDVAAAVDPDLVVTETALPDHTGTSLLRRLRHTGSRARFVVVTSEPTDDVRAEAAAAGALACLVKPVEARILLDFLRSRTTGPAAQGSPDIPGHGNRHLEIWDSEDFDDDYLDAELMDRLHEMYVDALPGRLSAIARSSTTGDTVALVEAAHILAGTSGQLGHPDVEAVCQAIASDARRGILAHARLVQLRELAVV